MKKLKFMMGLVLFAMLFTQCKKDDSFNPASEDLLTKNGKNQDAPPKGTFTVTIKNVSVPYDFFEAGAKFIPDGENTAGPAFPGHSFTFSFHAGPSHKLSFATMYGLSNDGFYATDEGGISLYSGGSPVTGDITSEITLWDAGTQVNQMPGPGNTHSGADENGVVRTMADANMVDMYNYGSVATNLEATLNYDGNSMFTVHIKVLNGSTTAISPVAWVVHSDGQTPIFKEGVAEFNKGLEDLAETGNAGPLSSYLAMHSGYVSPIAPGVWVVHKKGMKPIFKDGKTDYGMGLEMLSEMGDPSVLAASLMSEGYVSGVYNIPEGSAGPAPLFPGDSYSFTIDAKEGDYLSFASMLGKSNDLFFAPNDMGIKLFTGLNPINGDITDEVMLWDAGTEPNEYPGAGINQGPGGTDENEIVMLVNDGFVYPAVNQMIKVTIMKN